MSESSLHSFAPKRLTKAQLRERQKSFIEGTQQLKEIAEKEAKESPKSASIDLSAFDL